MNAKALLYIGLPLLILAALYVALKPALPPETEPKAAPALTPAPAPAAAPSATVSATPPAAPAAGEYALPATGEYALPAAAEPAPPAAAPATSAPAQGEPLVFALVARNNRLVSGPPVIKVKQGDEVTITITSDKADKLHLHGYDLHLDLSPGKPATLKFKAKLSGRFTYELHRADAELGALEVFPR